jgi:secretion/DNA translocation related TadE-like protein
MLNKGANPVVEARNGAPSTTSAVNAKAAERGSVAVLFCGLIAVAVVLTLAIGSLGGAVVLAGRAEAAADAAALAAADSVARGRRASACTDARLVAEIDGAELVECDLEVDAAEVLVQLTGDDPTVAGHRVRARSRAEIDVSGPQGGAGG